MKRNYRSILILVAVGLSVGFVAYKRQRSDISGINHGPKGKQEGSLALSAKSHPRNKATFEKRASGTIVEESGAGLPPQNTDPEGPTPVMNLEKEFIRKALARQAIDQSNWFDAKSQRYIKATLVKDDGQYGYIIIKQKYLDKEMNQLWSESAQIGDNIMVQFNSEPSQSQLDGFMRENHLALKKKMLLQGSYVFVSDVVSIDYMRKLEETLATSGGIRLAESNYLMFATATPNDPRLKELWGLGASGITSGWDTVTDCSAAPIALLDSGVDYNHQDLKDNMWLEKGRNFTSNNSNDYMDRFDHGTHCAGIIGAVGNNGTGAVGACWKAKIVPIKILGDDGSGAYDAIIDGIAYASNLDVKILSMSLGGSEASDQMAQAIEKSRQSGKLVMVASGNSNQNIDSQPSYPAAFSNEAIISVAAYGSNGDLANFSNYGSKNVDIAAPGVDIVSTVPNNGYTKMSGTSMATPQVAGIAAMLWSAGPNMKAADVKKELLANFDKGNFSKSIAESRKINIQKALSVLVSKISVANAKDGESILLVNSDNFEFQVKNESPYISIKSVEILSGSESLGKSDGEKVSVKVPYVDGKETLKFTIKVTDSLGKTTTKEISNLTVDVTKFIDLSDIEVGKDKGDVTCSFVHVNQNKESTKIFEAGVSTKEICEKICSTIKPTAYSSKGTLTCSASLPESKDGESSKNTEKTE